MLEENPDAEERLFLSAAFRTQYNMGGQIDDVSKNHMEHIQQNQDADHDNLSIITKLPWSKNVRTDTDKQSPWQILLGTMHPDYCVLLGLSTWLEFALTYGRDQLSQFAYAYRGSNNKETIQRTALEIMKRILRDPDFDIVLSNKKGNHSMRKFATDMVKKCLMKKDDIDLQFQWGTKRMQDAYASTTIPLVDGIGAAALCKDGPIHYHLKEYSGINDK